MMATFKIEGLAQVHHFAEIFSICAKYSDIFFVWLPWAHICEQAIALSL